MLDIELISAEKTARRPDCLALNGRGYLYWKRKNSQVCRQGSQHAKTTIRLSNVIEEDGYFSEAGNVSGLLKLRLVDRPSSKEEGANSPCNRMQSEEETRIGELADSRGNQGSWKAIPTAIRSPHNLH